MPLLTTEQVRRVLEASPRPMKAEELADAIAKPISSVGAAIGHLYRYGIVSRKKTGNSRFPSVGQWEYSLIKEEIK